MKSKLRGHEIEIVDGIWVYADDHSPTVENYIKRPCGHCDLSYTPQGHDGCLGTLENVLNACCGHGDVNEAYVQFTNGKSISAQEAHDYLNRKK